MHRAHQVRYRRNQLLHMYLSMSHHVLTLNRAIKNTQFTRRPIPCPRSRTKIVVKIMPPLRSPISLSATILAYNMCYSYPFVRMRLREWLIAAVLTQGNLLPSTAVKQTERRSPFSVYLILARCCSISVNDGGGGGGRGAGGGHSDGGIGGDGAGRGGC